MTRILLTTDAVGGIWTYALELAAVLAARGFGVTLAVLGPAADAAQCQAAAAAGVTLHETGLELDWTVTTPAALDKAAATLADLARRLNADLVQLHTPALVGNVAWPAPVLAVLHSCVGTWWQAVRGEAPPPQDFLWRMAAVKRGIETADAIVAPSRSLMQAAHRVYRITPPIEVVHNGRTLSVAALAPEQRFGVLTAGRLWDEGKNLATLEAAARLINVPVRAAGPKRGPNGTFINFEAVETLGVLNTADLAAAMAAASVFAAPALYEPFGLAVLEAAQAGLPLVLADIPTFRELWQDAALFLPARNGAAWATALEALHGDPARCRIWGERARSRAANYSTVRFANAMVAQYQRLAPLRASAA